MPTYSLVPNIEPTIFRGYDLRGFVDKDLNENVYYTLGRGYATLLTERRIPDCAVGRDNRLTSEAYMAAFIQGLNDGGINTYDLGYSMTQIIYYSSYHFCTPAGVMITASHNPGEYNGMKISIGYSATMESDDIIAFRELCASGKFSEGHGTNTPMDITPAYTAVLMKLFSLKRKWKIVVDTCNTSSGLFYPNILRAAGCEVIEQNTNLDGSFPLGAPDPTEVEALERLSQGVKAAGADIGFAYDSDGDRMAVVDNNGQILWMDTIVSLFAQDVLDTMPGAKIVYNTLCSRQVTEAIENSGGEPVMWMTGHSFIKAKLKEVHAPFGGELSGHIFFMDNFFGHDDGAYASLRLLAYLERTNQNLSDAVAKLSQYVSSPEIKFGLADAIKFQFIDTVIREEFMKRWPDAKYIDIDGIRMDLDDRMAIIRASQNGPYVTVKFEGKTQEVYDEMKHILKEILSAHPEVEWDKGVNIHALE